MLSTEHILIYVPFLGLGLCYMYSNSLCTGDLLYQLPYAIGKWYINLPLAGVMCKTQPLNILVLQSTMIN